MARQVWNRTISFGLVAIPVKLFAAVRKQSVSFNQLDDRNMARIRYRKVNAETDEEVPDPKPDVPMRMEVKDHDQSLPVHQNPAPDERTGRGMMVVDRASDARGMWRAAERNEAPIRLARSRGLSNAGSQFSLRLDD